MPSHVRIKQKKQKTSKRTTMKPVSPAKAVDTETPATNGDAASHGKLPIIEQEIKFARALAGNDPKVRTKVLKNLRKWLKLRSQSSYGFTDTDFLRLWKGLWYCMWMSDKPLVQEKLAEDLGKLIHCFDDANVSAQFFGCFMQTMSREWFGIDNWRLDKFLMLVRRMVRQMLFKLADTEWATESIESFGKWLGQTVYDGKAPIGLVMHFNDLYLEEISKVSEGDIEETGVHALLEPCILFFAGTQDHRLLKHTKRNIFYKLLMQSEMGQEYQEKYEIWKRMGFPCSNLDDLEVNMEVEEKNFDDEDDDEASSGEDENEDEEIEQKSLDLRAGRVDVTLHELKFDATEIVKIFEKYRFKQFTTHRARREIKEIIRKYKKFAEGEFPIGSRTIQTANDVKKKFELFDVEEKAAELLEYEEELAKTSKNLPKRVKKSLEKKEKRKKDADECPISSPVKEKTTTEENKENSSSKKSKKPKPVDEIPKKKKRKSASFTEEDTKPEDEWSKPLEDGETEIFLPSRKKKLLEANQTVNETPAEDEVISTPIKATKRRSLPADLNPVPSSIKKLKGKQANKRHSDANLVKNPFANGKFSNTPATPSTPGKRVQIVLQRNTAQDTQTYIETVKNSPQIPYDSAKKPTKGLLKANCLPGPINPRKIKLH